MIATTEILPVAIGGADFVDCLDVALPRLAMTEVPFAPPDIVIARNEVPKQSTPTENPWSGIVVGAKAETLTAVFSDLGKRIEVPTVTRISADSTQIAGVLPHVEKNTPSARNQSSSDQVPLSFGEADPQPRRVTTRQQSAEIGENLRHQPEEKVVTLTTVIASREATRQSMPMESAKIAHPDLSIDTPPALLGQPVATQDRGDCHEVAPQPLAMTDTKGAMTEVEIAKTEIKGQPLAIKETSGEAKPTPLGETKPQPPRAQARQQSASISEDPRHQPEEKVASPRPSSTTSVPQSPQSVEFVQSVVLPSTAPIVETATPAQPVVKNETPVALAHVVETLRVSAVAIAEAIQVSPTLKTTGVGEIRIELNKDILDGSTVRFEAKKGGELSIIVHPATQDAARVLETHLETFQAQLAERVAAWRVSVGVSAWNPKPTFKETEREA